MTWAWFNNLTVFGGKKIKLIQLAFTVVKIMDGKITQKFHELITTKFHFFKADTAE